LAEDSILVEVAFLQGRWEERDREREIETERRKENTLAQRVQRGREGRGGAPERTQILVF